MLSSLWHQTMARFIIGAEVNAALICCRITLLLFGFFLAELQYDAKTSDKSSKKESKKETLRFSDKFVC